MAGAPLSDLLCQLHLKYKHKNSHMKERDDSLEMICVFNEHLFEYAATLPCSQKTDTQREKFATSIKP